MTLILSGTDGLSDVDGSAATPAIRGTDANTGIFFPAADTIAFSEGGAEIARFDSSGNLGIGTSSPAKRLSVVNATDATTVGTNSVMTVQAGSSVNSVAEIGFSYGSWSGTNPIASLGYQITSNAGVGSGALTFSTRSVTTDTAPSERMRIDSSGNVGIGVTPSTWSGISGKALDFGAGSVFSATTGAGQTRVISNAYYNSAWKYKAAAGAAMYTCDSGNIQHAWSIAASGSADANITFNQAMTLNPSGYLLLGTTNTWFSRNFVSEATANAGVFISNSVAGSSLDCLNTATSGNNVFMFFYTESRGAPSDKGSIDFNRSAGLVRYNTTSDATLKNIIGDSDGTKSSQILKSTRIREYSWKEDKDNKPQIGVIAQELYETFKGAVSVGGDRVTVDEEGNETTKYVSWAVDKTAFTFHLIAGWQAHEKSIQELKALVDTQASTITQLQADVASLKGTP